MKVFIGTDHNGFRLKNQLVEFLRRSDYEVDDEGDEALNPDDDYPLFAAKVANAIKISNDPEARGILICGSGQGMVMAANRHKGIRAALGWNADQAKLARNDDDANVLALPAYIFDKTPKEAERIVLAFLTTPFASAARFRRRIAEMDQDL